MMVREHLLLLHGGRRFSALPFLLMILLGALYASPPASAQEIRLLEVRAADTLPEKLVPQIKAIGGVAEVGAYLYVRAKPHDVIGLGPGAKAKFPLGEKWVEAELETGRWLREEDKRAAVVGWGVAREDYLGQMGQMGGMAAMIHRFEIGGTFKVQGFPRRLRVVGLFSASPREATKKVFLPLATAQEVFKKEGRISHLLVTLKPGVAAEPVRKAIERKVGGDAKVFLH